VRDGYPRPASKFSPLATAASVAPGRAATPVQGDGMNAGGDGLTLGTGSATAGPLIGEPPRTRQPLRQWALSEDSHRKLSLQQSHTNGR